MNFVPIHTPGDLYQNWQALLGPLGFSRRSLWLAFIDVDARMIPAMNQIDQIPERVGVLECRPLLEMCSHVLADGNQNGSVALLLTRPGRDPMNDDDRSWGRGLVAAAVELGVAMHPVHFANDESLLVFAADDLIAVT